MTNTDGFGSYEPQVLRMSFHTSTETAEPFPEFNDPTLDTVIQWHIARCDICRPVRKHRPPKFGTKPGFCDEYWEIIAEYAEYEGHYAMRGNP